MQQQVTLADRCLATMVEYAHTTELATLAIVQGFTVERTVNVSAIILCYKIKINV